MTNIYFKDCSFTFVQPLTYPYLWILYKNLFITDLHFRNEAWGPFYLIWLCWEGTTPLPWCHAVFLISWLYHLNVLPYIPLANTSCLWVCDPKNTKLHISILYTQNSRSQSQRTTMPPSQPCASQHALLPGTAVERVMGPPWYEQPGWFSTQRRNIDRQSKSKSERREAII